MRRWNRDGKRSSSETSRPLRREREPGAYCRECDGAAREYMKRIVDKLPRLLRDNEAMERKILHPRDRAARYVVEDVLIRDEKVDGITEAAARKIGFVVRIRRR